MTKEDVLAMEAGVELDAKVLKDIFDCDVKIKGMSWQEDGGPFYCFCRCEDMDKQLEHRDCEHHYRAAISPSTDISAAWQVVEKLIKRYIFDLYYDDVGELWVCKLFDGQQEYKSYGEAPEAICRTALLTKLEGNPK